MTETTVVGARGFRGASISSWVALVALIAVGLYTYTDRSLITLQVEPMRHALSMSDFQIGLVQGLSVGVFGALVGYPIAWAADRFDRRPILAVSILVWCGAVIGCGLAQNFGQLLAASAVVGAAEAGLIPITYAMIPELFQGRARTLANSMVIVVGRVGVSMVIALSGLLVQHVGAARPWLPDAVSGMESWRLAFLAIALPGPLLAAMMLLLRLRPDLDARAATKAAAAQSRAASPWVFLRDNLAVFAPFYVGVGLLVFGMSAFGAFLPVVAMRQMGAKPVEVGAGMGSATLASTLVAMAAVVGANGSLRRLFGERHTIRLLTVASLVPALIAPLFLVARTPAHIFAILGLSFVFLAAGSMAFPTALQDLTPRVSRARLIAVTIMLNMLLSAAAPAVVGAVSDRLKSLHNGLMIATVVTAASALLLSALLLGLSGRGYLATVRAARAEEGRMEARP